jgi:dipeptidyl aminopeptidase/acylaminoacyl peptidase
VGDPPPVWGASDAEFYLVARDTVWRVPVAGGGPSPVGTLIGRELLGIVGSERAGRAWLPHGPGSLYVQFRDPASMKVGFATVDLAVGKAMLLMEEDRSYPPHSYGGVDAAGGTLAYLAEDTQHPPEAWTSGPDFNARRVVTNANPQLSRYRFGAGRLVRWRNSDGDELSGALILPTGYQPGHGYPLVVRAYGGTRQSRFANTFVGAGDVFVMQLFATRGFAVFMPDIPQRAGTPMRDIAAAVLPGIDRLVDLGIADPDRLGVLGHSYGGYSVLALLVQTKRFRAALASAGFSDLVSGYRTLWSGGGSIEASIESGQGLMGGTVWQFRERFIENSPFYYLDRVETPVLLVHGTEDTLPVANSDQTFVALRRLGKAVEYARYEGEGHAAWGAPNAVDLIDRMTAWFDERLNRPRAAAAQSRGAR